MEKSRESQKPREERDSRRRKVIRTWLCLLITLVNKISANGKLWDISVLVAAPAKETASVSQWHAYAQFSLPSFPTKLSLSVTELMMVHLLFPTVFLSSTLSNTKRSYIIRKVIHVNCRKFGKYRKVQKWKYIYTSITATPRHTISNIRCIYVFPLNKCILQNGDHAQQTACSLLFSLRNKALTFSMSMNRLI